MTRRRQIEEAAAKTAGPILSGLGLELLEAVVSGPGRSPVLRLTVDHPGGGVTVDELQAASAAVETALEVADVIQGRYSLEVSSPGIDRPWKRVEDFARHVGERVAVRTVEPLADGRRHLAGRVEAVEGSSIRIVPDDGGPVTVEFPNIALARPQPDWAALLRGRAPKAGKENRHEP